MKRIIFVSLFTSLCMTLVAQNSGGTDIVGTWQNDRTQQRFVFHADGTFVMSSYGEALEKAIREEQYKGDVIGTYAVKRNSVALAFQADGKTYKMTLRIVNADTLRMFGMPFTRVIGGDQ
jgi:uncharacterized protein (DUF2147 family)